MQKKILLIPAEIKSRDLYGRLYLAQKAAQRGYRVFIGHSKELHKKLPQFPRGLILEDDVTFQCRHFIKNATKAGYGIVSIDEESIAVTSDQRYVMQRIHYPNLEKVLLHFTRGEGDKEAILNKAPANKNICPLIPAGNTRIDLLREKNIDFHIADAPHKWDPNDVIVVMSRFSRSNPYSVTREEMRSKLQAKFDFTDEQFADFCKYLDHTDALFDAFVPMAEKIPALFPDKKVVFRPHPSENFRLWEDIAARHDNAYCIHKGTAVQWAINSAAMVHTGCTTAIESALLGANVLAYCPIKSDDYDVKMANLVSKIFEDPEELYKSLRYAKALTPEQRRSNAAKAREYLSQNMAGCLEQESCDIILNAIDNLDWKPEGPNFERLKNDAIWTARYFKNMVQSYTSNKGPKRSVKAEYQKQKFPDTSTREVQDTLLSFGAEHVKAKKFCRNWWEISV